MKQLDDFEKYLRDQLKGHVEPEPLMWKRLSDALGRVQPWYARSAFKYALTAFGSLLVGVITTYTYLEQKNEAQIKSSEQDSKNKTIGFTQNKPLQTNHLEAITPQITQPYALQIEEITAEQKTSRNLEPILQPNLEPNRDQFIRPILSTVQAVEALEAAAVFQEDVPDIALSPLVPQHIKQQINSLQERAAFTPNSSPFSLSVATGQSFLNLPTFNYQLGAEGIQRADLLLQQSPLFQLQVHLYKNWYLNTGLQTLNTTINERFEQTKVFSYDEKEHYLFPYIYGFRQISDEELQEGPWPFGPNPPGGGGDVSHVKANYQSEVRSQYIIVPLTLSYHQQFGVFEAQLHAGVALNFPYRTSQTLHVPGYAPSTIDIEHPIGQFQAMAQSQLRLSYLANQHLAVFIEPQIRSAFQVQNELHTLPYRNNTKAIYAGLSWKF